MPVHHNLALIHRMYEALNAQDLDAHDKYWTHDMIWHGPPGWGEIHGVDAFKYELLAPFYRAFPDYHAKNDVELADGDWVAATGYLTCTHQGEWLGLPATGRLVISFLALRPPLYSKGNSGCAAFSYMGLFSLT